MKTRHVFGSIIPFCLGVEAITLYPFVFYQDEKFMVDPKTVAHETVHLEQIERTGFFKFYLDYLWQFLVSWLKGYPAKTAYRLITYEIDAYNMQEYPHRIKRALEVLNDD